jgi:hypothetical protein
MSDRTEPSSEDDLMTQTLSSWAMDAEAVQKARSMLRLLPRPESEGGWMPAQRLTLQSTGGEGERALQVSRAQRADELAEGVVTSLLEARTRIDDLTSRLLDAHEDQQQAVACLRAELDARTAQLLAEKDAHQQSSARYEYQHQRLTAQLAEAEEERRRYAMELVGAEARELGTKAELERALADIDISHRVVRTRSRSRWWRLLFG